MSDLSVAVVITTYEPGPTIKELIRTIMDAGFTPIVVDDGSAAPPASLRGAEVLHLPDNRGIAAALNAGVERARRRGATHVITLDQDSKVGPDFVTRMCEAWERASDVGLRPAVVAPGQIAGITYRGTRVGSLLAVPEVMQSGAMFGIEQLQHTGGFDESLVIDCVDTDMCLRLRSAGWGVVVAPVPVEHELGRAREVRLGPRTLLLTRHAPFRDYYMARNRVLMIREHLRNEPRWALGMARRTLVAVVLTALFDEGRWTKVAAMSRGLWDGLRGRRGQLPEQRRQRWNGGASPAVSAGGDDQSSDAELR